jgi:hypothetical protein
MGLAGGGSSTSSAVQPTQSLQEVRRGDGVALLFATGTPPARERAYATQGVVALREPVRAEVIRAFVTRFFEACVAERADWLTPLVSANAPYYVNGRSYSQALDNYRSRMRLYDYTQLRDTGFLRWDDYETLREDELGPRREPLPQDSRMPEPMQGDVLVRILVQLPAQVQQPLFAERWWALLRRSPDEEGVVAVAIGEEPR